MENNSKFDVSSLPKELRFMLSLLNERTNSESISSNEIDWKKFIELAIHHRLYPLLAGKLSKSSLEIPNSIKLRLNQLYKNNVIKMLQLTAVMDQLSQMFAKQNIPALFLKGPQLAIELYGDISKRTSGDLDVLIPLHRLEEAEKLLSQMGYVKDTYFSTTLNDWKWRHHHLTFYHPVEKTEIELHWRLSPGPSKEIGFQDLWNRRQQCSFTNSPINMLGKEDLFLFLISHGARHGWSRLRWLTDIHKLTTDSLDFVLLKQLINKSHLEATVGQALLLSSCLFHTSLPEELKKYTLSKRANKQAENALFYLERLINLHRLPLSPEVSTYHRNYLFSLKSCSEKILFVLSFLYPYPEDTEFLPLPKKLHYLYFPLRPFLWITRKTVKRQKLLLRGYK